MLAVKWKGVEFDMNSGKEEPVVRSTGVVGPIEDQLRKLVMMDAMIQSRKDSRRVVRITEITVTLDQEFEPQDSELAFV